MNMVDTEKLNTLVKDKTFVERMMAQETPEDVQRLFNENGVALTLEDVKRIGKALSQLEDSGDELDEYALDDVAGGFAITLSAATCWAIAKAIIAIGGAALAIYKWYNSR